MLVLSNPPKKSKFCGLIFCDRGENVFFCFKTMSHVRREKGSIIKLVAFEAENYLEYMCQMSLSFGNGFKRY